MSSPISTSSRQVPVAPQRPAAPAQPRAEICRVQGDSLQLGRQLPPSMIEADLRMTMTGGTALAADGTVTIQKAFVDRLVRHALNGSQDIKDARIAFDAQEGAFSVQAKVVVKGIQVPVALKIAPLIDQNQVSFQFREVAIPTRFGSVELGIIKRKATEAIAKELRYNGFANTTDAKRGVVRMDVNSLLSRLGALPSFARIDFDKTRLSLDVQANGNMVVGMTSPQQAPVLPNTSASDISVFADQQALQQALRQALAPDYELQNLTLDQGRLKLDGKAEFKQGSDAINGIKALALILAVAARDPVATQMNTNPERLMVGLSLDIKQEGTQFVITPSIGKALSSLEESIKKAGLNPVSDGKSIRFDLNAVWKDNCGTIDDLTVKRDGAGARMRLDIDSFFDSPWLKRDSNA